MICVFDKAFMRKLCSKQIKFIHTINCLNILSHLYFVYKRLDVRGTLLLMVDNDDILRDTIYFQNRGEAGMHEGWHPPMELVILYSYIWVQTLHSKRKPSLMKEQSQLVS